MQFYFAAHVFSTAGGLQLPLRTRSSRSWRGGYPSHRSRRRIPAATALTRVLQQLVPPVLLLAQLGLSYFSAIGGTAGTCAALGLHGLSEMLMLLLSLRLALLASRRPVSPRARCRGGGGGPVALRPRVLPLGRSTFRRPQRPDDEPDDDRQQPGAVTNPPRSCVTTARSAAERQVADCGQT
jgi:hypothetical protein